VGAEIVVVEWSLGWKMMGVEEEVVVVALDDDHHWLVDFQNVVEIGTGTGIVVDAESEG